jgi:tripartite-type tricarboxylate transporter receptor subunit TctC
MLIVGPTVPAKTAKEFVAYAKAHPGKLNFVAPTGGPPHLAGELFKHATGIDIVPVSYRMMNQGFTDIMSGQMDMVFDGPAPLIPLLSTGKLHALVSLGATRTPILPDVPTMKEAGFADVQMSTWNGLVAPAGTPQPIVDRLNAVINDALKTPEMVEALAKFGSDPLVLSPTGFAALIKEQGPKWAELARQSGVKYQP